MTNDDDIFIIHQHSVGKLKARDVVFSCPIYLGECVRGFSASTC
jgi:hypothetical protein